MAQYKVPQDVEADDKLLGPFNFRQFVYLLIAGGLIALAVGLFQIFPLLAIIPLPFILLLGALALPLKKDQPMETYLAALVSYYLKPRTRLWEAGQRESTIAVTVPKKVEESRTRDLTEEEATHRLSFLAGIVDTKGYAIKGLSSNAVSDDVVAEANATSDMFETGHFDSLTETINRDENARYNEVVSGMRDEINRVERSEAAARGVTSRDSDGVANESLMVGSPQTNAGMPGFGSVGESDVAGEELRQKSGVIVSALGDLDDSQHSPEEFAQNPREGAPHRVGPNYESDVVVQPSVSVNGVKTTQDDVANRKKVSKIKAKPSIIELANNADFSVATIAKQANRIKERDEGEVFISLH